MFRLYVEKKPGFDIEARHLLEELKHYLGIEALENLRLFNRYDVSGLSEEEFERTVWTVFAEANADRVWSHDEWPFSGGEEMAGARLLAVEYLPGQFDQRADSAAQCVQILTGGLRPLVRSARLLLLEGQLSDEDAAAVAAYYINPVEAREAELLLPDDLEMTVAEPREVPVITGFIQWTQAEAEAYRERAGLAMSAADVMFCRDYFALEEKRDPTSTELKVIDTYWSDHCRHTTFLTELMTIRIDPDSPAGGAAEKNLEEMGMLGALHRALDVYYELREEVYGAGEGEESKRGSESKNDSEENESDVPLAPPISLMDMAVIVAKAMLKRGELSDVDESEEINACSIVLPVDVAGDVQPWLIQFKNETHNHPTEIEPLGGAATCLGGAIRDPLSGRAYVYQAMRVTGSADPRGSLEATLPGKLPQHKITTGAARGYSSYGNQIGLATGQVAELYHPDYVAKRMEIGAVIGAVPQADVRRERPVPGDVVVLLGGRTGRDGCGGATGSSKAHDESSLSACSAEVQKGDPPTERKIQRLFRNSGVSRLIKRCNDFGAGGVCVAIGELAEGLDIELDRVLCKYLGLDGTELAVSESQERMAVVLDAAHVPAFITAADKENLEATPVAYVSDSARLRMIWRGKRIVDVSRRFLDTNGVRQQANAAVACPKPELNYRRRVPEVCRVSDLGQAWRDNLRRLPVASQKGLVDMFDSTVGAGSVLMPFGGRWQLTPEEAMVAKIPLEKGETESSTIMSFGFMPGLSVWSPCHGSAYAVVEALAKVTAVGGDPWLARLTFQEYFERLGKDEKRWGKPVAALLGAVLAQHELGVPAIGGKDSMSGSFGALDVPPTLVCFAVAPAKAGEIVSAAFKEADHPLYFWPLPVEAATEMPDWPRVRHMLSTIHRWCREGLVAAASVVREGGLAAALSRMAFGNRVGVRLEGETDEWTRERLFAPLVGSILLELTKEPETTGNTAVFPVGRHAGCFPIGVTQDKPCLEVDGHVLELQDLVDGWLASLDSVFPVKGGKEERDDTPSGDGAGRESLELPPYTQRAAFSPVRINKGEKPRVLIPTFPGTNGEVDMARAFARSGAETDSIVVRNLTAAHIEQSVQALAKAMETAQIIAFPGGFSGGDEPDGSGKFIAAMFRHHRLREGLSRFFEDRDGLIIGICNGFQVLIKLGLLPGGSVIDIDEHHPALTFNSVGHHMSLMAYTRVVSLKSPWLRFCKVGQIHGIPVSHGEGRFVASRRVLEELSQKGQIVAQYVDAEGQPSMEAPWNPNGSCLAIEAVCSPDGRILGKMGHSERTGPGLAVNVPGDQDQRLFEAGVSYFTQ